MTEPKTRSLEVPGAVLCYDVRGSGSGTEPALLLIGSPMGAAGFGTLASHFADRTVVTYDPRGSERSERTDDAAESTPDEHADDLHRPISALDAAPVDIFASSGGAVNALTLVAKHPRKVRTLVAHEPPAAQELPDRGPVLAACVAIHQTYLRDGFGPGDGEVHRTREPRRPLSGRFRQPARSGSGRVRATDRRRRLPQRSTRRTEHHLVHALPPRFRLSARSVDSYRRRRRSRIRRDDGRPRGLGRRRTARDDTRHLPRRPRRLPRRRIRQNR